VLEDDTSSHIHVFLSEETDLSRRGKRFGEEVNLGGGGGGRVLGAHFEKKNVAGFGEATDAEEEVHQEKRTPWGGGGEPPSEKRARSGGEKLLNWAAEGGTEELHNCGGKASRCKKKGL